MTNEQLANTLRIAADDAKEKGNLALYLLLTMAAERLEETNAK